MDIKSYIPILSTFVGTGRLITLNKEIKDEKYIIKKYRGELEEKVNSFGTDLLDQSPKTSKASSSYKWSSYDKRECARDILMLIPVIGNLALLTFDIGRAIAGKMGFGRDRFKPL